MSRQVSRPQAIELDTFGKLARAHTVLRRELESEALTPRGLTMTDFEAMLHLSRAEDNRLRRVDLVERLMLTPSGVTRLLDGLEEDGLVENVRCDDDALDREPGPRDARVDLVERLMLTPSGVTRLLDGLEEDGLVENVRCDDDARVTWARLTVEGVETLECVGATYAARLQELFGSRLTSDEVVQLTELLGKLPGVGAGDCAAR